MNQLFYRFSSTLLKISEATLLRPRLQAGAVAVLGVSVATSESKTIWARAEASVLIVSP